MENHNELGNPLRPSNTPIFIDVSRGGVPCFKTRSLSEILQKEALFHCILPFFQVKVHFSGAFGLKLLQIPGFHALRTPKYCKFQRLLRIKNHT